MAIRTGTGTKTIRLISSQQRNHSRIVPPSKIMRPGFILALLAMQAMAANAQTFGEVEDRQTNVVSYFYHVLPGEATMQIYVWGTVRAPGLYVVSEATDLGELLALAGGPQLASIRNNDRREVTVRLFHMEGEIRTMGYETSLEEMIAEPGAYPALRDGDIIEVATHEIQGFSWRDILTIAGGVAAVALAVERIVSSATN